MPDPVVIGWTLDPIVIGCVSNPVVIGSGIDCGDLSYIDIGILAYLTGGFGVVGGGGVGVLAGCVGLLAGIDCIDDGGWGWDGDEDGLDFVSIGDIFDPMFLCANEECKFIKDKKLK